ncbi:MAG TPA: hypothetical protein VF103_18050 [Polyangiaceae bacterium]
MARRSLVFFSYFALANATSMLAKADPPLSRPIETRPENGYWSTGKPRWFVSTHSDFGTPYFKPYFSAGYGMPHWIWAGVDVNGILTTEMTQFYGGVRASSPLLDLAFGARDTFSFQKPFLEPRRSYTYRDVYGDPGDRARYWAWEAEAVGVIPLPHFAIVGDFIVVRTLDVPDDKYVYDESYRAIVADTTFGVLRVAPVIQLLKEDALKVGILGEWIFEAGRYKDVFRLGPAGALQLTDHLEALAGITFVVSSPDNLGLVLGTYGTACVRYRWATGEDKPALPWNERFIP